MCVEGVQLACVQVHVCVACMQFARIQTRCVWKVCSWHAYKYTRVWLVCSLLVYKLNVYGWCAQCMQIHVCGLYAVCLYTNKMCVEGVQHTCTCADYMRVA